MPAGDAADLTGAFPNRNKPKQRQGKVLFINADAEYYAGRAQNYLQPQHIEKIASTFERYDDVPNYARAVPFEEISDPANDFNLNIRRYVDNSPPPEPHDVRAHLVGGVPTVEIESQRPLFDALGFDPGHAFVQRNGDGRYHDFAASIAAKSAIGPLLEQDVGVAARGAEVMDALGKWWKKHAKRPADLPARRDLNAVRSELLASFTKALQPVGVLDRFTLDGVVATWWTDSLPDLKTLMENGFGGVIDGWVDAIADAVDDDDNVGPAFDPFSHKLVLRTMADYLQQIDDAKAEVARLKGEKEALEQSNPPDDADDEELAKWNYAKDLEQQAKDLKSENRDALAALKKLEKAATKKKATDADREAFNQAKGELQSVFDESARIEGELAPYEKIKTDLAAARATFRELTGRFVDELQTRCAALNADERQALVMELFARDLQTGLEAAVSARRQMLIRAVESLWDKYSTPLDEMATKRDSLGAQLSSALKELGYVG